MRFIHWLTVSGLVVLSSSCTAAELNQLGGDGYALDEMDRSALGRSDSPCHPELLVRYSGIWVKLEPPSPVAEPFTQRLARFEELLVQLGSQVYGRAPSRILHVGTYACRAVELRQSRLSEHALGNAIDVTGFRFPALSKQSAAAFSARTGRELPPRLRGAFTVSVASDYPAPEHATSLSEHHQRFFKLLRQSLREGDVFRGVIGPPDPAHRTHFHLDMAPWSYQRL